MKPAFRTSLLGMSLCLWAAGCASTPRYQGPPLTGDPLIDGRNRIEHGVPKDKVLWQYRTARVAMQRGLYEEAARDLDAALQRIQGVYGLDDSARQSRRLFNEEAKKTFIGEPYERVMAYYLRGILYWMDGEPDNARACFRSGQLHDSDTEDRTYASDYLILEYLEGYTTAKLGGDASDEMERAKEIAGDGKLPPYNPEANVFFFVDFGPGPTKYASGAYGEQLRFRIPPSPVQSASLQIVGKDLALHPWVDVAFQATTRGGRVMDHVLGNKAVFKSTTSTVGDAAILGGAVVASGPGRRDNTTQAVGLGLVAAGILTKFLSEATSPEADTRSWDNLPRFLSFAAQELPPGEHTATIQFKNESGQVLPNLTKTVHVHVPPDGPDKVVYINDQSVTPQSL